MVGANIDKLEFLMSEVKMVALVIKKAYVNPVINEFGSIRAITQAVGSSQSAKSDNAANCGNSLCKTH